MAEIVRDIQIDESEFLRQVHQMIDHPDPGFACRGRCLLAIHEATQEWMKAEAKLGTEGENCIAAFGYVSVHMASTLYQTLLVDRTEMPARLRRHAQQFTIEMEALALHIEGEDSSFQPAPSPKLQ